jgi:hypothetical protein
VLLSGDLGTGMEIEIQLRQVVFVENLTNTSIFKLR